MLSPILSDTRLYSPEERILAQHLVTVLLALCISKYKKLTQREKMLYKMLGRREFLFKKSVL